jgi:hypothetical protein
VSDSENAGSPGAQAQLDYRSAVERLVAACLARIRRYELPDAAEPPAVEWPDRD